MAHQVKAEQARQTNNKPYSMFGGSLLENSGGYRRSKSEETKKRFQKSTKRIMSAVGVSRAFQDARIDKLKSEMRDYKYVGRDAEIVKRRRERMSDMEKRHHTDWAKKAAMRPKKETAFDILLSGTTATIVI